MKKRKPIRYGLTCLAIIGLIIGVISYAAEFQPTQTPEHQTHIETSTDTLKKKSCRCCAERTAHLREKIRQAREHMRAAQPSEAQDAVSGQ